LSAARTALPRIETAATRMHDKLLAASQARDWSACRPVSARVSQP
jgi:hypothetical protein